MKKHFLFFKTGILLLMLIVVNDNVFAQTMGRDTLKVSEVQQESLNSINTDSTVYEGIEVPPKFPGGTDSLFVYLSQNKSQSIKVHGMVLTKCIVENTGFISSVRIVLSGGEILDKEAIRLISCMPQWTPGKQDGRSYRTFVTIPVRF